jgi:hypothetical protein
MILTKVYYDLIENGQYYPNKNVLEEFFSFG